MKTIKQHLRESKQINEDIDFFGYDEKEIDKLTNFKKLKYTIEDQSLFNSDTLSFRKDKHIVCSIEVRDKVRVFHNSNDLKPKTFKEDDIESALKYVKNLL